MQHVEIVQNIEQTQYIVLCKIHMSFINKVTMYLVLDTSVKKYCVFCCNNIQNDCRGYEDFIVNEGIPLPLKIALQYFLEPKLTEENYGF